MAQGGPPAHLTGSVIVLDQAGEQVLLTLHQKARRWFQFGGHFEAGDGSMRQEPRARRGRSPGSTGSSPCRRSSCWTDTSWAPPFGSCREHLDVRYAAIAPPGAAHSASHESVDVRWWPADRLPEDTREELLPLVRAAQALIRR